MKRIGIIFGLMLVLLSANVAHASGIRTQAYATTTASLNLRSGPGTGYSVYRVIPAGARVWVYSGPYNSYWYKVSYSGTTGYVYGSYLSQGSSTTSSGSGKGYSIAQTAQRYLGYRYAWGGESPSTGFDCSGLVKYVYGVYGIYLPHSSYSQSTMGSAVSTSNLRPGDILVFAGTDHAGVSHVAIYIGGGWMVGADNPSWGVHKDYLYDSYWWSHYWGARRIVN